jgi:hypothetical protein
MVAQPYSINSLAELPVGFTPRSFLVRSAFGVRSMTQLRQEFVAAVTADQIVRNGHADSRCCGFGAVGAWNETFETFAHQWKHGRKSPDHLRRFDIDHAQTWIGMLSRGGDPQRGVEPPVR